MALLFVLACCSLFVGVIDLTPGELLAGNFEQLEIFIISRLPRPLALLCTGIGMSVAGGDLSEKENLHHPHPE
ncbi:iron chelate uptake ABC transporter family permease subunit [uncultured Intestinimonas sp.]|uniref:iron chelate uptake ABC transporter family permease subunit n=1 Tax=uncultured Intestinimonas sp. TaxID=1689265 RepID=UPI002941E800|nr:iron chelate uptake ABC transporter family permease subunit [uncultured Intestinimonas sp.]